MTGRLSQTSTSQTTVPRILGGGLVVDAEKGEPRIEGSRGQASISRWREATVEGGGFRPKTGNSYCFRLVARAARARLTRNQNGLTGAACTSCFPFKNGRLLFLLFFSGRPMHFLRSSKRAGCVLPSCMFNRDGNRAEGGSDSSRRPQSSPL